MASKNNDLKSNSEHASSWERVEVPVLVGVADRVRVDVGLAVAVEVRVGVLVAEVVRVADGVEVAVRVGVEVAERVMVVVRVVVWGREARPCPGEQSPEHLGAFVQKHIAEGEPDSWNFDPNFPRKVQILSNLDKKSIQITVPGKMMDWKIRKQEGGKNHPKGLEIGRQTKAKCSIESAVGLRITSTKGSKRVRQWVLPK